MKKLTILFLVLILIIAGGSVAFVGYFEIELFEENDGDEAKNIAPVVHIVASPENPRIHQDINFEGNESYDSDGDDEALNFTWDFDDGRIDTGKSIVHSYNEAGNYRVTLTVSDEKGATGNATISVRVRPNDREEHYEGNVQGSLVSDSTYDEYEYLVEEGVDNITFTWDLTQDGAVDPEIRIALEDANHTEFHNETYDTGLYSLIKNSFDNMSVDGDWKITFTGVQGNMHYECDIRIEY